MFVDASHPANRQALQALASAQPLAQPLTPADEANDPYYGAGCHPEVVGWMWETLAREFPPECQCLVYGVPCVVQPASGILLAIGMGTAYCLRILPESMSDAASFGCTPVHTWGGDSGTTDLQVQFGEGWVFGSFGKESIDWCRVTSRHFSHPPRTDAVLLTPETRVPGEDIPDELVLLVGQLPQPEPRVHTIAPDAAQVATVVRGLDWSRMTFVVLRTGTDRYLELSGSLRPEDGLSARYVDGDVERITTQAPTMDVAIRLLQSYAAGDSSWKTLVDWE